MAEVWTVKVVHTFSNGAVGESFFSIEDQGAAMIYAFDVLSASCYEMGSTHVSVTVIPPATSWRKEQTVSTEGGMYRTLRQSHERASNLRTLVDDRFDREVAAALSAA